MGGIFANMYWTFAAAPPPRELTCLSQTARAEYQPDSVNRSVWYTPCIDFCRTPISLPSGQRHYCHCTNYIMHEESPSLQYLKHSKTLWHQNRQGFQFVVRQIWAACICDKLPCKLQRNVEDEPVQNVVFQNQAVFTVWGIVKLLSLQ